MGKGALLLLSLAVVAMGYLLYLPLPPEFEYPWRSRALAYGLGLAESMASVGQWITGKHMGAYLTEWSNRPRTPVHLSYPELEVQDKVLNGVNVRLYRRRTVQGSIPAVVYLHGGGWVIGSADGYDGWNVRLALMTNMTVVAVTYRKAPVHPYPAPFEDCVKATMYVLKHGAELGVDPKRVAVAGDSAGGNLAAAVALKVGQEDPSVVPPLKLQVLLCPALQAMTFQTASYRLMPRTILSQQRMIFFWAAYLNIPWNANTLTAMLADRHVSADVQRSRHGSYVGKGQSVEVKDEFDADLAGKLDALVVDPFVSPLMADDKMLKQSALAPAYVVVFEFDQLKDEGLLYADRLKASGVPADVRVVKGQPHPALALLNHPVKNQDYEDLASDVAEYIVGKMKMEMEMKKSG